MCVSKSLSTAIVGLYEEHVNAASVSSWHPGLLLVPGFCCLSPLFLLSFSLSLSAGFTCSHSAHLYVVTADVNSSSSSANVCLEPADFGSLCTLTVIFYTLFTLLLIHLVLPKCIAPLPSLPSLPVNGCFV